MFSKLKDNEKTEVNSIIKYIIDNNIDPVKLLNDEEYQKKCVDKYKGEMKNEN